MRTVWHEDGRSSPPRDEELRQAALGMLDARRAMRGHLPAALIHDVALEMMLALFCARPPIIGLNALLDDLTVPAHTARRWLSALASERLLESRENEAVLTEEGRARLTAMLTSVVLSQRRLYGWAEH